MFLSDATARLHSKHSWDASEDLVRNIHGIAKVADLDGDEVGYLVATVAEIKRLR